jgi:hypothetical protein
MDDNGTGVSALLGLDGFVVRVQVLDEATGEWWLAIETSGDRAWCPSCVDLSPDGQAPRRDCEGGRTTFSREQHVAPRRL